MCVLVISVFELTLISKHTYFYRIYLLPIKVVMQSYLFDDDGIETENVTNVNGIEIDRFNYNLQPII